MNQRIQEDIEEFARGLEQFRQGHMELDEFKRLRLQNGIYSQRQQEFFMIRVKIPFGAMTNDQMLRLSQVSEQFSKGGLHVTTRQDVQLYWIVLENLVPLMRQLAEVGLTSRESAGNTVRNVTACHLAGVCLDESFDVTPYAQAVSSYFLHHPFSQNLPRKFKIAFSGCEHDCGLAAIHDLGAIGLQLPLDGRERRFFRLLAGGGLGSAPRLAQVLESYAPAHDILEWTEAILWVFNEMGERSNRSRSRLKFLIEKIGIETFRQWVKEKRQQLPANPERDFWKQTLKKGDDATPHSHARARGNVEVFPTRELVGNRVGDDYQIWKRSCVISQRQAGYKAVSVFLPQGDIKASALRELAEVLDHLGMARSVRTTNQQNLVIRWVGEEVLPWLHRELVRIGLAIPGVGGISDVTACPGSVTCQSAITQSKFLGRTLTVLFKQAFGEAPLDLADVRIKMSGCPNSCAQYQLGTLGLYGASKSHEGKQLPYYQLLLGGHINGAGPELAQFVISLPAKRVPMALMHLVEWYRSQRERKETLADFLKRKGPQRIRGELEPFTKVVGFYQERDLYYDWGCDQPFAFDKPGAGECG